MKRHMLLISCAVLVALVGLACAVSSPPMDWCATDGDSATPEEFLGPLPAPGASSSGEVSLVGGVVFTDGVVVTVTVRSAMPTAYLFDLPVLRDGDGGKATPRPDSLEEAHFALVDAISRGEATVSLAFPRPTGGRPWTLVLNPRHRRWDVVAPRVEIEVLPRGGG